jgi:hypothetical protein
MDHELSELRQLVKLGNPQDVVRVEEIVENYFAYIGWSKAKEEYEVSMTEAERQAFLKKLFQETAQGSVSQHIRRIQDESRRRR